MKSIKMFISGNIKGSGFGLFSLTLAERYGITGYMEYSRNGTVIIKAEGQINNVNKFINSCIKGNQRSRIDLVRIESDCINNYTKFKLQNFNVY